MMSIDIDGPETEPDVSLPARKVEIVIELPEISLERRKEFVVVEELDDDHDGNEVSFYMCLNSVGSLRMATCYTPEGESQCAFRRHPSECPSDCPSGSRP